MFISDLDQGHLIVENYVSVLWIIIRLYGYRNILLKNNIFKGFLKKKTK